MPLNRRIWTAALLLALSAVPAAAEIPADGSFVAAKVCPALQSIRKETNPGGVMTEPGISYVIIAKNQKKPTHFRVEVPGAEPSARWVDASCGSIDLAAALQKKQKPASHGPAKAYVLAISWQPAFCEGNPKTRECRSQTDSRYDASHFALHGLWPQPGTNIFCGISEAERGAATQGRWSDLPRLDLSLATQGGIERSMPGSQSFLDRYEWTKHGTCYPVRDAEIYYGDSLRLIDAVNASPVQALMARSIGQEVSATQIRASFDEAFGKGAGERVRVACRDDGSRRLIAELTIGLTGDIPGGTPVRDLIFAAGPTDPGCPSGIVDAVGRQ